MKSFSTCACRRGCPGAVGLSPNLHAGPGDFTLAGVAISYDSDADGRATNVHVGVVAACYVPRLCRCTGYINIVDAVCEARAAYALKQT